MAASRIRRHCWIVAVLVLLAANVMADDALPGPLDMLDFQPLEPGTVWEYEVHEDDELKHQQVELRHTDDGRFMLTTKTGARRARYELSQDERGYYLHSVRYRLALLPFSKTTRFEPPLVYLRSGILDTLSWNWQGEASGVDRELREAYYRACIIDGDLPDPPAVARPGDLLVTAEFVEDDGARHRQRAVYRHGIGLLSVVAENYEKRLVRWKEPASSEWNVPD